MILTPENSPFSVCLDVIDDKLTNFARAKRGKAKDTIDGNVEHLLFTHRTIPLSGVRG